MSQETPDPNALFADVTLTGGAIRVRLVGPSIGQREGDVVAEMVRSKLTELSGRAQLVVLDFTDVQFINSAGLGACVVIHRAAGASRPVSCSTACERTSRTSSG